MFPKEAYEIRTKKEVNSKDSHVLPGSANYSRDKKRNKEK